MNQQLALFEMAGPQGSEKTAPKRWRPDPRQARMGDLPPAYREVASIIGLPSALALVKARGGTVLLVPEKPRPAHILTRILGQASASVLARRYGGDRIHIPTLAAVCAGGRNRSLRAVYDAGGVTIADLAAQFGLSARQITAILNQTEEA